MPDQNQILLQTKLHWPSLPKDLVSRTRLVERLNRDMDHQLILVSAPAGFGKTTLIGNWLKHIVAGQAEKTATVPAAWLSLDENDSDLNLFLRYIIAALRTIFANACEETLMLLQARRQPPQSVLSATLSNEIERLSHDFILVLDDYHTLHGTDVHDLLTEWVRHWPKPLHLVLISRINPPLPLSSLRAKRMLSEIHTRDLRFTEQETAAFLSHAQVAHLDPNVLSLLEERLEGWPAGLHLAALSLHSAASQESILSALSSENTNLTSYLVDEVLTRQFPAIHSFLLKTSILDRFCASLCEGVLGESDAAWNARACLDWIERSELFLIPLDDRQEWYRYHHLFQELLQQRLSAELTPGEVNNLHLRASAWFEENGFVDEAMQHALAAGDLDLAARQMYSGLREALNREDRPTLERWMRLLPEELIQRKPELLMIRAWSLQFLWRHDLQAQVLRQVEELLDSGGGASLSVDELQILRGQILLPRAQYAYFRNQTALAIDLCRQALTLMPPSWTFVRGGAMIYLGLAMQAGGEALAAEQLLLEAYESYSDKSEIYALFILQSLCFIYLNTGRLEQTRQMAQVLIKGASRSGLALMKYWGIWFLAVVSYQRDELEAAAQFFTQIFENRYVAQVSPYRDAVAGLALIHQIKSESTEALELVESISQYDLQQRGSEDERTRSLRARLMLLQGDLDGASRWAGTLTDPPPDRALLWLEEPQATRARVLLARGTDADLQSAGQILDILDEIADRTHNTHYKITILALRSLLLDAQGATGEAVTALQQALDLARPGGFTRVFVDLGTPMQAMLQRLAQQDHSAEAVRSILVAFPEFDKHRGGSQSSARHPVLAGSMLVEPLTPRELEVLNLLREPLSIKEIAQKLCISHATAKRHTSNIYGKLGVNRRWDAVTIAEDLHILPLR